jgi:hypothetical protein
MPSTSWVNRKSIPGEAVRNAADYVAWLTATLEGLRLDRISLVGMSVAPISGGWFTVGAGSRLNPSLR